MYYRFILPFAILLFSFALPVSLARAEDVPSAKVGVLLSFSGGLEQWCGYIRQGIELAASEDDSVKIDLIFEDDRSVDKKSARSAAEKLLSIDKVDILVSWTASTVPVLAPISAKFKTPFLVGAYDSNVAKAGPYAFGAFVNYDLVPRDIARFLVEKKGARRLALVMAEDDWSQNFEGAFRDEAQKLGASIVSSETISPYEKDTRALILRLKQNKVDAVLAPLYAGSLYSFIKEVRELHFSGLIHVGDGMFEEDLKVVGAAAEGVFSSQIQLNSEALSSAFAKKFKSNPNPLQLGLVASGYDWVTHLQGAIKGIVRSGHPVNRETLRQALKSHQSNGYLGPQMYGAPPSQAGEVIMVVKGGKYEVAE